MRTLRHQLLDRLDQGDGLDGADELVRRDTAAPSCPDEEGSFLAGQLCPVPAVAIARSSNGSSMSVTFWTYRTSWPESRSVREQVERHIGCGMAQVGCVIGRDSADIERRGAVRRDLVRLAAGRVVEAKRPTGPRNHGQERRRPRDHGVSLNEGYAHTRPGAPAAFGASRFRARATGWPASRRSDAGGAATAAARSPADQGARVSARQQAICKHATERRVRVVQQPLEPLQPGDVHVSERVARPAPEDRWEDYDRG